MPIDTLVENNKTDEKDIDDLMTMFKMGLNNTLMCYFE